METTEIRDNEIIQPRQQADKMLFWAVLGLLGFGILAVYSASASMAAAKEHSTEFYVFRHIFKVIAGVVTIWVLSKVDYHLYAKYSKPLMVVAILALFLLLITGGSGEKKGAARWFEIGPVSFQPSELAKWTLILHLSVLMSRKAEWMDDFKKGLLPSLVWIGATVFLIALQPNFSTAAVISAISLFMLFIARANLKFLIPIALAIIPLAGLYVLISPYRLKRITMFLSGHETVNYQLAQSIIALGNGGFFGAGIGQSKQRDFFLPEPFNDFILPIIGEEYGFIGVTFLLAVFVFIMYRGIKIIKRAPDLMGMYLASGIVITIIFYAFVNAAVTCGLFPTTGLPMPFISYGGTSILFTCAAVGILLNISKQGIDLNPVHEEEEAE
ncbi:MAG: putative lipid II flippase FtsW [Bacteroidetes bacterium]|nr:putative lipid II flippase FtsW [Bacteroidota bacterium]